MPTNPGNIIWAYDTDTDKRKEALDFFTQVGWNPHIASGIVANFDHESGGLNPNAVGDNGNSFGIGQWNGPRKEALFKYAAAKGEKSPSFRTQLEFTQLELNGPEAEAGRLLRTARTPEEATRIFSEHYERPGNPMMKSRLSRAADIVSKFISPSEAQAAEGPADTSNVIWAYDDKPDTSGVVWAYDDDDKSILDQLAEHPTVQSYMNTAKDVARLPGQVVGLVNTTLAAPMGVIRAYNKREALKKESGKARSPESILQDQLVQTPEGLTPVDNRGWNELSRREQWSEAWKEAGASAWESIMEPGKWGATGEELDKYIFGKTIKEALPEKYQWAAPALEMVRDVLYDPATWMTFGGKALWTHTAKSVLGDDLFKNLSKVGKVPELEKLAIPKFVLDDMAKLEALDDADKQSILKSQEWMQEIRANPPIQRGDPNFPRPQGEAGAIRRPTVTPEIRPPGVPLDPIQRAQLDISPEDISNAQLRRGTGIQPSPVADVTSQRIETPTPAELIMQRVREAAEQRRMAQEYPQQVRRGTVAQSPIADVQPVQQQMPAPMQRIMDMIEENRRMKLGEASPMPQRAAPMPDQSIAARVREMPVEVQQKLRGVLPEEIAAKVIPEPVSAPKVAPEVIQTAQGPKLQKTVDIDELVKPGLSELEEWKRTREPGFGVQPKVAKIPEPGIPASKLTDSHLVNAETMGQVEQRIMSGNVGIRDELGKIYDSRIKAEGKAGDETFQDWMNPQKVGGRIYQELRKQGVEAKEAKSRLAELMKDYESKYNEVLQAKRGVSNAQQAGGSVGGSGVADLSEVRTIKQAETAIGKVKETLSKTGVSKSSLDKLDAVRKQINKDLTKSTMGVAGKTREGQFPKPDISSLDDIKFGDFAESLEAKYAGKEVPSMEESEKVIADIKRRIQQGAPNAQEAGAAAKKAGAKEGVKGGASGRIRLRDNARVGVEAQAGAEEKVIEGAINAETKAKFDDYWVRETKAGVAQDVKKNVSGMEGEIKRLKKDIKSNPNDPGNALKNKEIERLSSSIAAEQQRLKAKAQKPSSFMSEAQLRYHMEKAESEGKFSPLDILKSEKGAVTLPKKPISDKAIREKIGANADVEAIEGMIGEPKKERWTDGGVDKALASVFDRFRPIHKVSPEAYNLARFHSATKDVAQLEFNELKRGLHKVRKNFDTFEKFVTARRAETRALMTKESTTDPKVAGATKTEQVVMKAKKEQVKGHGWVEFDVPTTETKWTWQVKNPNDVSVAQARAAQDEILKAWKAAGGDPKELIEAADFWDDWTKRHILQRAADSGLISKEAHAAILASNDHYAAFSIIDHLPRDLSDVPLLNNSEFFSVANQPIIKGLKGTTKQTVSPIESTINKFLQMQYLSQRNKVASTFIDEVARNADSAVAGKARPVAESAKDFTRYKAAGMNPIMHNEVSKQEWEVLSRFVDGKVERWAIDPQWGDVLKHMNEVQVNRVISVSNRIFKKTVTTAWLPFGVGQVAIDTLAAFNTSPVYKWSDFFGKFWYDYVKALSHGAAFELLGKDKAVENMLRSGGGLGFYGTIRDAKVGKNQLFSKQLADMTIKEKGLYVADTAKKLLLSPITLAEKVVGATEIAPRLAVFERALKQGKTPVEAAMLSRDATIDFYKSGHATRVANMWIPFLNARVQGKANLATAALFRKGGRSETWAKLLSSVGVPFLTTYAWNTYRYKEHYDNIDSHVKDSYIPIIYGETKNDKTGKMDPKYILIPKGDIGQAILNPWEHMLDAMYGKNPRPTKEFLAQFLADLILPIQTMNEGEFDPVRAVGSITPPLVKAVAEPISNKNWYTGRDIDPQWMVLENVPPHLRGNDKTPALYDWAAKGLKKNVGVDWSPNVMQNVAQNIIGPYGRAGLDPKKIATAVSDRFVRTTATANINRAAKVYYQIDKDYQQLRYTAIDMVKNGKVNEAKQMLRQWNQNLRTRLSDMNKFGYRDKGGAKRDYSFSSDKIDNIIQKGRKSDRPTDWLEERLQNRSRRR